MYRFAISLLTLGAITLVASAQPEKRPFPALPEKDAWGKLPPRKPPALPMWARVLAGSMPKTTAKMLELDYLHRAKNPLGPVLAGKIRWFAAEAVGCEYARAAAEIDLRRAGLSAPDFVPLADPSKLTPEERALAIFVAMMTQRAKSITDQQFAELLKYYGPEKTTAIVHTVAYANFHNRVLLGLGVRGESPPAPPLDVHFDTDAAKTKAPARPPWDDLKHAKGDGIAVRVEWSKAEFAVLNTTLEKQKERKGRIPLPDLKAFERFPPREKQQAEKIVWMTVSAGYQPEMTRAWFACLNAYYEESRPDRVFTNSVFWVVTRTNDCFY